MVVFDLAPTPEMNSVLEFYVNLNEGKSELCHRNIFTKILTQ